MKTSGRKLFRMPLQEKEKGVKWKEKGCGRYV
jgi:hypothetical protein